MKDKFENFKSNFLTNFKLKFKTVKLPLFLDLLRWKALDIYRFSKTPSNKRKLHFYGVRAYVGLYGGGKTMSLVNYLERMREKHGNDIYIITNFYYKNQDYHLAHWDMMYDEYDRPVLFAIDEIQNEFNSRDYRNFPPELVHMLTQNRKGFGKQVLYTCINYGSVDKNFREITELVTVCRTYLGRLTRTRTFERLDFESMVNTSNIKNKLRHRSKARRSFVQSDHLRNQYDSFQTLETAKSKEYLNRDERLRE